MYRDANVTHQSTVTADDNKVQKFDKKLISFRGTEDQKSNNCGRFTGKFKIISGGRENSFIYNIEKNTKIVTTDTEKAQLKEVDEALKARYFF